MTRQIILLQRSHFNIVYSSSTKLEKTYYRRGITQKIYDFIGLLLVYCYISMVLSWQWLGDRLLYNGHRAFGHCQWHFLRKMAIIILESGSLLLFPPPCLGKQVNSLVLRLNSFRWVCRRFGFQECTCVCAHPCV